MRKAFTLIETIVVVAVIGLTLPVLFAIIFTLIRQQVKIYRLSQIKREGDYVINLMENTIRNKAVTIYSTSVLPPDDANIVCNTVGGSQSNPYFLDENKLFFNYELSGNKIVFNSAIPVDLTSSKIKVSLFSISCSSGSAYSPPSVSLNFDIEYCNDVACSQSPRPEERASMHYQTRIKLRSH